MVSPEFLAIAVKAVINLDKSKSGAALLHKLANLATTDVEGLDTLLANGPSKMRFAWWTR